VDHAEVACSLYRAPIFDQAKPSRSPGAWQISGGDSLSRGKGQRVWRFALGRPCSYRTFAFSEKIRIKVVAGWLRLVEGGRCWDRLRAQGIPAFLVGSFQSGQGSFRARRRRVGQCQNIGQLTSGSWDHDEPRGSRFMERICWARRARQHRGRLLVVVVPFWVVPQEGPLTFLQAGLTKQENDFCSVDGPAILGELSDWVNPHKNNLCQPN